MKSAPAPTALLIWSMVRTVPAPSSIAGNFFLIRLIDSSAASVLKVISTAGRSPARREAAKFSESPAFSIFTTGKTPIELILSHMSSIRTTIPFIIYFV